MPSPASWVGVPLQKPDPPRFTFFQQGRFGGLVDHLDPHNLWKYWVNSRTGEEFASNLSRDPLARVNVVQTVDVALRNEWRRRYVETLATHRSP